MDYGSCVSECSPNKVGQSGKCVPCDGPCPKGGACCLSISSYFSFYVKNSEITRIRSFLDVFAIL